jgi:hypothetical protein
MEWCLDKHRDNFIFTLPSGVQEMTLPKFWSSSFKLGIDLFNLFTSTYNQYL